MCLGSKDLAVRSVLPPIVNEEKLTMCLNDKDFQVNHIDRKLQVRMVSSDLCVCGEGCGGVG